MSLVTDDPHGPTPPVWAVLETSVACVCLGQDGTGLGRFGRSSECHDFPGRLIATKIEKSNPEIVISDKYQI
jgi:hypothetical protein